MCAGYKMTIILLSLIVVSYKNYLLEMHKGRASMHLDLSTYC